MSVTDAETRELNRAFFNLLSGISGEEAVDAISNFTRAMMRGDPFLSRILPPLYAAGDELDRAVGTDRPLVLDDDLAAAWARSADAPVAVVAVGNVVFYLPGECSPLRQRRPRVLEL